ncbi:hypothetical protein PF002_g7399 [Phytophthora fragariae]|nr:hypothetical protein PF002_g7399 [Phytophthora fragariae]
MGEVTTDARVHVVNAAIKEAGSTLGDAVMETTLQALHKRLGHIAYDTVERMAPSKNNQSKKDTGKHAPIDKIGGVIGSDIKGLMTPRDRRGNRYFINFIDYPTNYVRVFLAKNKMEAAKQFEHFLAYFEKWFNCRDHVLRTDGGKGYANVDLFCKAAGERRQVSKAGNQATNGKAE